MKSILDKYRVLSVLSDSGDTVCMLATHNSLDTRRIIKRIKKCSPFYKQLIKEAHLMKNLRHPCIPVIYDMEEDEDYSYIIEQYIEGKSLRVSCSESTLSENSLIRYSIKLCNLISYLHTLEHPILHLDIKPENIIICDDALWLIDFGSARYADDQRDAIYSGTRGFASPEQLEGKTPCFQSDIYSIGMIIKYMSGNCLCSFRHARQLNSIIRRCIYDNPGKRFSSVAVLMNQLCKLENSHTKKLSEKPLCYAVAGAAPNIGTTHIALLLSRYLSDKGSKSVYIEYNMSYVICALASVHKHTYPLNGVLCINKQNMMDMKGYEKYYSSVTDMNTVFDLGTLNETNLQQFCRADYSLLILSGREWEHEDAETALSMCRHAKKLLPVFNMTEVNTYSLYEKALPYHSVRMPYYPDLWSKHLSAELRELFENTVV